MATRPIVAATAERPPKHPGPIGLPVSKKNAGSYVHRFKLQRERIKTLHDGGRDKTEKRATIDKSLPKLPSYSLHRDPTGLRKFTRSNTIESFKLPGVGVGSTFHTATNKKQILPVKTFHLKLQPEHSNLSKSMPSLPSIPGSPSQSQCHHSPHSDYKDSAFPSHGGKHRYQRISFQKTIHLDRDSTAVLPNSDRKNEPQSNRSDISGESVYNNVMPQKTVHYRMALSEPDRDRSNDTESCSTRSVHRSRRSRRVAKDKDNGISDTKSEGGYAVTKKWKDHCTCLRCQMLRRQYKEGDDHYNLWGQYPCHHVADFNIGLDDD